MAYAEKRGDYWRARYKKADGNWASASFGDDGKPFTTREAAENYGDEQEADIRRNLWRDPRAGDITLTDWVNRWFRAQHLEETTLDGYRWHIEVHILPYFGEHTLRSLNTLDINAWEIALSRPDADGRRVCGPTSAASARTLLHTILSDAVSQGLIPANPAVRARNRGRKADRSRTRGPEEVWATPLEALLVAERASLLSGRDDEFILLTTIAYTGMRWAEIVGLERQYFRLSTIRVEQQVYEHKGQWRKKPPKDNSYRTIHLPPFLSDLLSRQLQRHGSGACSCTGPGGCGGGRYVFLPEEGTHERRSNFGRRRFRPAVDGRHADALDRPGYPVLADVADAPWPGVVRRSWPAAIPGEEFAPPRRRGFWSYDMERHHVVSWLPVKPAVRGRKLKVHGLRHGHKVWLDELSVPAVASEERLGHELPGIVGTYSHTSPEMVRRITEGLQERWEESLRERAKIAGGRSPVLLLDDLLRPFREIIERDRLPDVSQATVSDLRPRPKKVV
ncbi:site-specific integrase [Nonomuraea wenchangensis]|uniref:site-specific integrase n=1 Tax=Nonomuraea wenchangensis TaxID=568860 RepID=UPI003327C7E6